VYWTMFGMNLFTGFIVIFAGLPMWLGWIGPNRFWGFRTPRTLSDERVWYAANGIAGKGLTIAGLITLLISGLGGGLGLANPLVALMISMVVLGLVVAWSFVKTSEFVGDLDAKEGGDLVGKVLKKEGTREGEGASDGSGEKTKEGG
jgi:uncharacterized membrane protein